ncbi:SapC family protein [Paraferrimonas sp. SM1919]|uniref:SapC family protein n=1 Tax=Paraferrimonas sp. SM1919 TaxID=2662263 RepID=UPI0013D2BA8C|nr:SapC family protein [Paraferrimonas sp. SM1919]
MSSIQIISLEKHANTRIVNGINIKLVKTQMVIPAVVSELHKVALDCPVAFVKSTQTGQFEPVGLYGVKQNENVFIVDQSWSGNHLPHALACYPFLFTPNDNGEPVLGLDESSELLGSKGNPLFVDGKATSYLINREQWLIDYAHDAQKTVEFCQQLAQHDLLCKRDITVTINGEQQSLNGIYIIDEEKLKKLSPSALAEFNEKGYLRAVYAAVISLNQLANVIKKANELATAVV